MNLLGQQLKHESKRLLHARVEKHRFVSLYISIYHLDLDFLKRKKEFPLGYSDILNVQYNNQK